MLVSLRLSQRKTIIIICRYITYTFANYYFKLTNKYINYRYNVPGTYVYQPKLNNLYRFKIVDDHKNNK